MYHKVYTKEEAIELAEAYKDHLIITNECKLDNGKRVSGVWVAPIGLKWSTLFDEYYSRKYDCKLVADTYSTDEGYLILVVAVDDQSPSRTRHEELELFLDKNPQLRIPDLN